MTKGKLASGLLGGASFGSGLRLGSGFEGNEGTVSGVAVAVIGGAAATGGGGGAASFSLGVELASWLNLRLAGAYSQSRPAFSHRLQRGNSPEHLVF